MSETKTDEELAREWMSLRKTRWPSDRFWRLGMVNLCQQVIGDSFGHGPGWVTHGCPSMNFTPGPCGHQELPDLSHPGTRAFLLEDVRKAWACGLGGRPLTVTYGNSGRIDGVSVWQNNADVAVVESTAFGVAALIEALRAAPGEEARRG